MDVQLKELTKIAKLTSPLPSGKRKAPSVQSSLDSLLRTLQETKEQIQNGTSSRETLTDLQGTVDTTKKDIDERQKEIYNSLARLGKAMDKVRF